MKVFYHLFPTWYCCRYSPKTLMTKISSAMLIFISFSVSFVPSVQILSSPECPNNLMVITILRSNVRCFWVSMNSSIKRVLLHSVATLYFPTIICLQRDRPLLLQLLYVFPYTSMVLVPMTVFLMPKSPFLSTGTWILTLCLIPCTLVRSHPVSLVPAQECCHPARQTAPACLHRDYSGRSHHKPGLPLLTPCPSNAENACGHKREGIHIQPRVLKQLNRLVQK